jgi:hypothetical protein
MPRAALLPLTISIDTSISISIIIVVVVDDYDDVVVAIAELHYWRGRWASESVTKQ